MKDHKLKSSKRRDFLKLAGLGAGAAGVAAAGIARAEAKVEAAKPEDHSRGYRESEHVKKYYALARF
ncbi:MAG TPA: ubiquinol-cytochrome c reductase iron-sulfur subunit N-terminal domain-containing protein [Alphaproteobacteria bacterium]|nr:ubiquinol-cytochrome c reductase iron-sulfur subunit N-terminal domain-containing protein [Alphaproteobacteria bacterium]